MNKPEHWSPSRLDMIAKCGKQYEFRYLDGIRNPPSIAMAKGSSIHSAQQENYRQKRTSFEDLPTDDLVDLAVETFRAQTTAGELALLPEEVKVGPKVIIAKNRDKTAKLAEYWAQNAAGRYQPKLVERWFNLQVPDSPPLVGVIDLLDDQNRLVDLKTSGKKKSQQDADSSTQLTVYHAAVRKITGSAPSGIYLDNIVQTPAGKMSHGIIETSRGGADLVALTHRIAAANKVVESGAFMPAPPGAWWCSKRWCGYFDRCPHVKGRKE